MSSCPRCPHLVLTPGHGVIDEDVCGGCGGRFLSGQVSDRFVVFELGIERDVLREIASLFSGPRLPCPGCQGLMRSLRLRGVPVDLCLSCGGLWLDAGELVALSGGRHLEIGAPLLAAAAEPAVLGQMPPLVNASRKPGEWQAYDIVFEGPRFNPDGTVAKPAIATVHHNGVLTQNHTVLIGHTPPREVGKYTKHGEKGPNKLQDHGEPMHFRNIWIREVKPVDSQ